MNTERKRIYSNAPQQELQYLTLKKSHLECMSCCIFGTKLGT